MSYLLVLLYSSIIIHHVISVVNHNSPFSPADSGVLLIPTDTIVGVYNVSFPKILTGEVIFECTATDKHGSSATGETTSVLFHCKYL